MFSKFKRGEKVIVYGFGENEGRFYKNVPAVVIEKDPYYHDYLIKFKNGKEDWLLEADLRKPYQSKKKRS